MYIRFNVDPVVTVGTVISTVDGKQTGAGFVMITTGGPVTILISKLAEAIEVHPAALVTVKL